MLRPVLALLVPVLFMSSACTVSLEGARTTESSSAGPVAVEAGSTAAAADSGASGASQPSAEDFPGPHTTGPSRTAPRLLDDLGDVKVHEAGTIIEGAQIGCLDVRADDVVVRDSVIKCGRPTWAVLAGGQRLLLEDVEIDGLGRAHICVAHSNYTLRRANVHSCSDGARANGSVTIEDSWIHSLVRIDGSHNDAVQTTQGSGVRLTGNTLQPWDAGTQDPKNAAYLVKPDQGPVSDIAVVGNYIDGGNFSMYIDGAVEDIVVRDNWFTRNHRYGPVSAPADLAGWARNRYLDGVTIRP